MEAEAHPLIETWKGLAAHSERIASRVQAAPDAAPGWLTAADLAQPDGAHVGELLGRVAAHYKTSHTQAPAALWFGHYAYAVAAVPIACYLTAQRVPRLTPAEVWARFDERGDVAGLAWTGRRFAALAADPAAAHPDATVLAGRDALRDRLREEIVNQLTPVVETVRGKAAFGKAGLWALAADYCASIFTWIGRLGGNEAAGADEARLFAAAPSPVRRTRDFIHVEHCDRHYYLTDRTACCLYYKVAEDPTHFCSTCPLRPKALRIARVKGWLEQEAAEAARA